MNNIDSNELEEYIKFTISSITNGISRANFEIIDPIEFDLAVTNTAEGSGGLKVYIAKAEGKLKSEEISRIKFKVAPQRKSPIQPKENFDRWGI